MTTKRAEKTYHHGDLRNALLDAARALLEESGLEGLSLRAVARKAGVSPFRQFADMFRLKGGKTMLTAKEYYEYQVYHPELTLAQKREFVGEKGSFALNLRLAPPGLTNMRNFLADKVGLTSMMGGLGLVAELGINLGQGVMRRKIFRVERQSHVQSLGAEL